MSGILTEFSQAGTALLLLEYQMNYSISLKFRVWYEEKYSQLLYYPFHIDLGAVNCLCPANSRDLTISEEYSEEPNPPGSLPLLEAANEMMIEHELQFPESIYRGCSIYLYMLNLLY